MNLYKQTLIIFIFCLIQTIGLSQANPHIFDSKYNFINHDKNVILLNNNNTQFDKLFTTINKIMMGSNDKLHIYHFGDSHIQADYFSGQMRRRFHDYFYGADGSRGLIFPFDVAGTNNPSNYRTTKTGTWSPCKNISNTQICNLGMAGISITTFTPNASLSFNQQNWDNYPQYFFDRIKIFHDFDSTTFAIKIESSAKIMDSLINEKYGYTEYTFDQDLSTIKIIFFPTDTLQTNFVFHGITLESTQGGITYSSSGVNGADVDDWLKCNKLQQHLLATQPDLIIISLGTNDCYPKVFNQNKFEYQYDELIKRIKSALPDVAIILTTPSDNFRYKRYLNENTPLARLSILNVAKENECAVWDLQKVMGGLNSIVLWSQQNLTAKDKLHFSKKGYELQGDLLFCAFIKLYDEFIEKQNNKYTQ